MGFTIYIATAVKMRAGNRPIAHVLYTVAAKLISFFPRKVYPKYLPRPAHVYARSLQSRLLVSARDLQNRTRVIMSPVHGPEQHAENHDPTVHQNAVIHVLDVRVCRRRPHGEEGSEQ